MKSTSIVLAAIVAAITLLQLPACSSRKEAPDPAAVQEQIENYRAQEVELVRSTVLDEERADRFIALMGQRDQLISAQVKEVETYREEMTALNADFNAEREDFDELLDSYNSQRESAQQEIVALISNMKKETTPDEWKVISKFQLKRLNPRQTLYSQTSGGN